VKVEKSTLLTERSNAVKDVLIITLIKIW